MFLLLPLDVIFYKCSLRNVIDRAIRRMSILLIFFLLYLSATDKEMLKHPIKRMAFSISPLISIHFCLTYIFKIINFLGELIASLCLVNSFFKKSLIISFCCVLKSAFSEIQYSYSSFLLIIISMNTFIYSYTFCLMASL